MKIAEPAKKNQCVCQYFHHFIVSLPTINYFLLTKNQYTYERFEDVYQRPVLRKP